MATLADPPAAPPRRKPKSIAPDLFERFLAVGAAAMLAAVAAAIVRGYGQWDAVGPLIWFHLVTIMIALVLTPLLLLQRRGTRLHRRLGWTWAVALVATAIASFWIRHNNGGFSWIHVLSVITVIGVPAAVAAAHWHKIAQHRLAIRMIVTGALLIAGFFTFPFGRLLGRWLLG